jgi:hypothetical protein
VCVCVCVCVCRGTQTVYAVAKKEARGSPGASTAGVTQIRFRPPDHRSRSDRGRGAVPAWVTHRAYNGRATLRKNAFSLPKKRSRPARGRDGDAQGAGGTRFAAERAEVGRGNLHEAGARRGAPGATLCARSAVCARRGVSVFLPTQSPVRRALCASRPRTAVFLRTRNTSLCAWHGFLLRGFPHASAKIGPRLILNLGGIG